MIAEDVDVNARDRRGVTGLVLAMRNNMVSTVRLLLACQTIRLDSTEKDTERTPKATIILRAI